MGAASSNSCSPAVTWEGAQDAASGAVIANVVLGAWAARSSPDARGERLRLVRLVREERRPMDDSRKDMVLDGQRGGLWRLEVVADS